MQNLIKDIKTKLGIEGGSFIDAEIQSYIEEIDPSKYLEFFKALSGEHNFSKPMDRIANTAKKFKNQNVENLLQGTREQAKAMYDKFYSQNCAMTDYAQANRDKVPNDREFFENLDYANLKQRDGASTYTKQELYVLSELGGGSWLCDIRFYQNLNDAVSKIESIIKKAITTKYDQVAIASSVRKLIGDKR